MLPRSWRRNGWRSWHIAAAASLVAIAVAITADAWYDIARTTLSDQQHSHVLIVPAVVAWLIWVRRLRLRRCRPNGRWIGVVLAMLGWLVYQQGRGQAAPFLWHSGALMLAVGSVLLIAGRTVLWQFFPAFVALIFLVPLPGRLRPLATRPLEAVSAEVSQTLISLIGVQSDAAGHEAELDRQNIAMLQRGSSVRMMVALALVSYAIAFAMPLRAYSRAVLLLACPICAIVCSICCLAPTLWMRMHYSIEWANRFYDVVAWAMPALAFLLLFTIPKILRWALAPVMRHSLAYD